MRKYIFCITAALLILAGIYSFFGKEKAWRLKLWLLLDKDIIYLKNGDVVQGWLWKQESDLIVGRTEKDEMFVFKPSECEIIQEDVLLRYFEKLI